MLIKNCIHKKWFQNINEPTPSSEGTETVKSNFLLLSAESFIKLKCKFHPFFQSKKM